MKEDLFRFALLCCQATMEESTDISDLSDVFKWTVLRLGWKEL